MITSNTTRDREPVELALDLVRDLGDAADRLNTLAGKAGQWRGTLRISGLRAAIVTVRDQLVDEVGRAEAYRRSLPPRMTKSQKRSAKLAGHAPTADPPPPDAPPPGD